MKNARRKHSRPADAAVPSLRIAAAVMAVLIGEETGSAAIIDWSGSAATDTWTLGSNWISGIAPANDLTTDIARFNQTAYATQPNAGAISINGIQIGDGTTATAPLTISGTSLSIGSSGITIAANAGAITFATGINLGTAQSWINNSANTAAFTGNVINGGNLLTIGGSSGTTLVTGVISGTGGFLKSGSGTVILSGGNTYTGLTTINSGVLQIGNNDNAIGLGNTSYQVAAGAQLVFARNTTPNGAAFLNQSISGGGDVIFKNQSTGYFTLRGNYTGTLSYTGRTIVDYDPAVAGTTWFQRALWLEKDNLLPHATVLDLLNGKVFLRANEIAGETVSGLAGNAGTFITTDQGSFQKFTVNVPNGATYTYNGVIGVDASPLPIEGLNAGNITFRKNGLGTQILTGANTYAGGTIVNAGTLVLSGANVFDGPTNINGGTLQLSGSIDGFGGINVDGGVLALDFATQNTNKIGANTFVSLGGGNLAVIPNNTAETSQPLPGLGLNPGASSITVTKNSGANNATLSLNAITRNSGSTLNIAYAGTGTGTASATTDSLNSGGILGGWATFNGIDWAVNSTNGLDGRIAPLASGSYTANTWAAGTHTDVTTNSAPAAGATTESVRFNTAAATVTLSGTNTINSGGILITPNVGNNTATITGGTIRPGTGGEIFVHQNNSASPFTLTSTIADNGGSPTALTKTGPGTLVLADTNTYTGRTTLSGGIVRAGKIGFSFEPGSLGSSSSLAENLVFSGGSILQYTGPTSDTDRAFTVNGAGGGVEISNAGSVLKFQGDVIGTGGITKSGPGTLILGGINTYAGDTIVSAGTLQVGDLNATTQLNPGNFFVGAGAQLVFSRNNDNVAFITQSISGPGDVIFRGQSNGYFTLRGNYGGQLTYGGRTIVDYDPDVGGTWFQRTLWLEKDDLLPHSTILELRSGKVYMRANVDKGETISGLIGGPGTRISTEQGVVQKLTINVASGQTYTFEGEIGNDPALNESTTNISVTKTGPGTQVLSGANTFTGGLQISEGTLKIGAATSSATAVGPGVVTIGTSTTNGTLDLNAQSEIVKTIRIGTGANPNQQLIGNSSTTGDATLVSTGTSNFAGLIVDSVNGGTRKTGINVDGGTLTLTNANTYTGNTRITAGKLVLAAGSSLGNTPITVASGGVLGPNPGTGAITIAGSLTLENGSTLDLADGGIGALNITGSGTAFFIGSGAGAAANLNFDLSSTGADRITVSNAAAVIGANTIGITVLGTTLTPSSTYTLISAASGLGGTFQFANGSQQTSVLVGTSTYRLVLANTGTAQTISVMSGAFSTWAGSGSTTNTNAWNQATNWSGALVPGSIGTNNNSDTVVFSSSPSVLSPNVDAGRNIQNIIFDTAAAGTVNLTGSSLALSGGGIVQTTATVTNSQTISTPLVLHGNYRFSSGSSGVATLNIAGPVSTGAAGSLILGGSNAGDNTISGAVSDGAAPLNISKVDAGRWVLTNAANSFTGSVTINGGALAVNSLGSGLQTSALGASSGDAGNLVLNGGALEYRGSSTSTDRSFTLGASGGTIDVRQANANLAFSSPATGPGGLTKTGPGQLTLEAINTYAGNTTVSAGTLQLGNNNPSTALPQGNFEVAAGATLVLSRNIDNVAFTTQSISGAGDVKFAGQALGYFTWRGNYVGTLSYTGKTIVDYDADAGGTWFERGFWLEKDDLLPHATVLDIRSAKVFLRANNVLGETISGLTGNADTYITTDQDTIQRITINTPSGQTYSYPGTIGVDSSLNPIPGINAGNISLTKNGGGKQILSGNHTYVGPTTVNGGTLVVSGSIGGAATTVNNGGTLASGVNGTIRTRDNTNITVAAGGHLAPGDIGTVGVLTLELGLSGKLTFAAGSILDLDLSVNSDMVTFAALGDWLEGSGNLTLALAGAVDYGRTYTVFENVTTPGFTLAGVTGIDALNYSPVFNLVGTDYRLSFVAVPEPGFTSILVASLGCLLGLKRHRRGAKVQ